jgi:hypothetical protein
MGVLTEIRNRLFMRKCIMARLLQTHPCTIVRVEKHERSVPTEVLVMLSEWAVYTQGAVPAPPTAEEVADHRVWLEEQLRQSEDQISFIQRQLKTAQATYQKMAMVLPVPAATDSAAVKRLYAYMQEQLQDRRRRKMLIALTELELKLASLETRKRRVGELLGE